MGDTVNFSARLMQNAQPGTVLCCIDTHRVLVEKNFEVAKLDPIMVKGKAHAVPVFRPSGNLFYKQPLESVEATSASERAKLAFWENQPPARASTSDAWQDPSAPLLTDFCSGGCPAAGARLPSCCLSAMAVFALFHLPVRCELLVCHAIIHEQSTVQFLEVVVA